MSPIELIASGALVLNFVMVAVTLAGYLRGGRWNTKSEVQQLTATLTTHDERLKTVERRIGELPTSSSVEAIKTAVEKLDLLVTGKLENVSIRLEHSEKERTARAAQSERELSVLAASISRVEDFLLNQPKPA